MINLLYFSIMQLCYSNFFVLTLGQLNSFNLLTMHGHSLIY